MPCDLWHGLWLVIVRITYSCWQYTTVVRIDTAIAECGKLLICGIEIAEDCRLAKWTHHVMSPCPQITRQIAVFWKPSRLLINMQLVYRSNPTSWTCFINNNNYIRGAMRTLNSVLCCLIQRVMRTLYKTPQDAIQRVIVDQWSPPCERVPCYYLLTY